MEIYGIGNDIIEVKRILKSIKIHGQHFLDKLFTQNEQQYCNSFRLHEIHFAGRYAAKEAVAKSLGTGFGKDLKWLEFEIINNELGKPEVIFLDNSNWKKFQIQLSISHCRDYASAVAICLK